MAGERARTTDVGNAREEDERAFVVQDLATLKAIADPLRQTILSLLDTARTVKELSAELGKPADRLYYHLGLLERHGLVKAIEARGEERRYVVVADKIEIDPTVAMPAVAANQLVTSALDQIRKEYVAAIRRTKPGGKKTVMLGVRHVMLDDDERAELMGLLEKVTEGYMLAKRKTRSRSATDERGRRKHGVVVGLWPVIDAPEPKRRPSQ